MDAVRGALLAVNRRFLCAAIGAILTAAMPVAFADGNDPGNLVELRDASNHLHAQIAPQRGGELVGLEYQHNGRWIELLYRGQDFSPTTDWDGKAPILWPATGRNFTIDPTTKTKAAGWISGGTFFPMPIHGFARDLPWNVTGKVATADGETLALTLGDNPETRKSYPFGFTITTEYTVGRAALTIHQRVHASATNKTVMPFSIGNHMTFKTPPSGNSDIAKFATPATTQLLTDDTGRPTGRSVPFAAMTLRPVTDIGMRKAVSLSGFPRGEAWIQILYPSGLALTVSHRETRQPAGDPVLFNLWGDPAIGFFAPEPWVGKQNSLVTGDGTVSLAPGDDFEWTITVILS